MVKNIDKLNLLATKVAKSLDCAREDVLDINALSRILVEKNITFRMDAPFSTEVGGSMWYVHVFDFPRGGQNNPLLSRAYNLMSSKKHDDCWVALFLAILELLKLELLKKEEE